MLGGVRWGVGEIKILEAEDKANVNLMVTSENRENLPHNQCRLPVFLLFAELRKVLWSPAE